MYCTWALAPLDGRPHAVHIIVFFPPSVVSHLNEHASFRTVLAAEVNRSIFTNAERYADHMIVRILRLSE